MTTTTQITNIAQQLDLTDYAGEFVDDYDMDAVHADYVSMLDCDLPDGITLCANGDVIADIDLADQARNIDWSDLTSRRPVQEIFDRHDVTNRFRDVPSATGTGTVTEGRDSDGNLVITFGPDTLDGDGNPVEESDDSWTITQWIDGCPRQTINDTRTEIEHLARKWMKA